MAKRKMDSAVPASGSLQEETREDHGGEDSSSSAIASRLRKRARPSSTIRYSPPKRPKKIEAQSVGVVGLGDSTLTGRIDANSTNPSSNVEKTAKSFDVSPQNGQDILEQESLPLTDGVAVKTRARKDADKIEGENRRHVREGNNVSGLPPTGENAPALARSIRRTPIGPPEYSRTPTVQLPDRNLQELSPETLMGSKYSESQAMSEISHDISPRLFGERDPVQRVKIIDLSTEGYLLPVLEVLSYQTIRSFVEVLTSERNVPGEGTDASNTATSAFFEKIKSVFDHTKAQIDPSSKFLEEKDFIDKGKSHGKLIFVANIASALLIVVQPNKGQDLNELHSRFMELFVPTEHDLEDWHVDLLIAIKKLLLTTTEKSGTESELDLIERVYPSRIADYFPWRTGVSSEANLSWTERTLVDRCKNKRAIRHSRGPDTADSTDSVVAFARLHRSTLEDIARNLFLSQELISSGLDATVEDEISQQRQQNQTPNVNLGNSFPQRSETYQKTGKASASGTHEAAETDDYDHNEMIQHFALAARAAVSNQDEEPEVHDEPYQDITRTNELSPSGQNNTASRIGDQSLPYIKGTAHIFPSSTQELYERAKLAASAKAAAKIKGLPLQPSQRRPWSADEENALMTGLDRVQGPHWSQILAMYGAGGTISEVLKDRNQVQLKDKARNLKLFFLKSGYEVPHYLKNVTGELKTRAPAQASKSDIADTRERSGSEEPTDTVGVDTLSMAQEDLASEIGSPQVAEVAKPENDGSTRAGIQSRVEDSIEEGQNDEEDIASEIEQALKVVQHKTENAAIANS